MSVLSPGLVTTRIADAYRNRPTEFAATETTLQASELVQKFSQTALGGKDLADVSGRDPNDVADLVVAAIYDDRFALFTHPELSGQVVDRATSIIDGKLPSLPVFV